MRDIEIILVPPSPHQAFGIYASSRDCGRVGDSGITRFVLNRPVEYTGSLINLVFGARFSGVSTVELGQLNTYVLEPPITNYKQFDLQVEVIGNCSEENSGALLNKTNRTSTGLLWNLKPLDEGTTSELTINFGTNFTGSISFIDNKKNKIFQSNLEDEKIFQHVDKTEVIGIASLSEAKIELIPKVGKKSSLIFDLSSVSVEKSNKLRFFMTPSFPQYPSSSSNPLQNEFLVKDLLRTSVSVNRKIPEIVVEPDGSSAVRFYNYYGDPISSVDLEDYVKFEDLDEVVVQKRFETITDAESYIANNNCIGCVFSIHNGSEWLLYIVDDENKLSPINTGVPIGSTIFLDGGTSTGH